ncbi:MAG TPA: peptidoglycan-associated lipoprotein Pal [Nitrospira sp.]|nr:peptidoglycan-associated lipoprotein Pal [Nitrospira sp.]
MGIQPFRLMMALVVSAALVGLPGCSKKSVQSGGDSQSSQQRAAKSGGVDSGGVDGAQSGVGSFPDTTMQSGGSGLRGLDKNPSEERIGSGFGGGSGNGPGSGTMLAKADPSGSSSRQLDEMRAEQAASAAAGLRDVFFGYDSWTISEEGRQALSRDAEWMKSNPGAAIKVEGHCDERGTSAYNLVLGEKRAKAVRNYLVELGVGANRLSVVSYGKERPFCNDHAETCYQQNRRGHLVVKSGK